MYTDRAFPLLMSQSASQIFIFYLPDSLYTFRILYGCTASDIRQIALYISICYNTIIVT